MPPFSPVVDLADLDGSNGFALVGPGNFRDESNGADVAGVGDVNGDGFDDVLSGAPRVGNNYDGFVNLTLGTDAPRPALGYLGGGFSSAGGEYEYMGGVAPAGDINGDGLADFIASGDGGTLYPTPANYIVFGNVNVNAIPNNLGGLNGGNGFKVHNGGVMAAGDVNGDGFDDLLLGNNVVFGKASGFSEYVDSTGLDGSNGFALTGGFNVRAAGDVNGDGFADIIAGNPLADSNGTDAGDAYVVFGKGGGFAASFAPDTVDGTTGFTLVGAAAGDLSGASVAGIGDVNGDGFDDMAVRAPGAGPGGTTYVVFGRAAGFGATVDLGTLDPAMGFRLIGAGAVGVAAAGDIDGDTLGDIVVGTDTVVFGRAGAAVGDIDVTNLAAGAGFTIIGSGIRVGGMNVAGAGDINGDGLADLVVGAPRADDPAGEDSYGQYPHGVGIVYFVHGQLGAPIAWTGTSLDEFYVGSGDDDVLNGGRGKDHLKGVGGDDLLIGGSGSDLLDGGDGSDTVGFAGASNGVVVDLGAGTSSGIGLGNDVLVSIENVLGTGLADDITGDDGANRLDGAGGADTMRGGLGDDSYVVDDPGDVVVEARDAGIDTVLTGLPAYALGADVENLTILSAAGAVGTGNSLANVITGGDGDDHLNGGRGADILRGGAGNDSYRVDHPGDVVDEAGGGGIDTVETTVRYTLGAALENLVLRGTGAIAGTGNELANVMKGNIGNNTLIGLGGDDNLTGGNGDDKMLGGDGNDVLSGGISQFGDHDMLRGGLGDDTYIVFDGNDVVSEAHGGGIDTVRIVSTMGYTLPSGVENIVALWGRGGLTGNSLDNTIMASSRGYDDVINGMRGNDVLSGRGGADIFVFGPGFGHDRITDFAPEDRIRFEGGLFADADDVMAHAAQVGNQVVISYSAGNAITISGYQIGDLAADDFLFA